jgi:L-methionine (R)-S-oxide reductase
MTEFYKTLNQELSAVLDQNWITNLANASAILMTHFKNVNWAGFYLTHEQELILGPFQGKPACLCIPFGKGVCGIAAQEKQTIIVDDVHSFEGYIACDSASLSEIVVPLLKNGRVLGVLDIDSPIVKRFNKADQEGLEEFSSILLEKTRWPESFL